MSQDSERHRSRVYTKIFIVLQTLLLTCSDPRTQPFPEVVSQGVCVQHEDGIGTRWSFQWAVSKNLAYQEHRVNLIRPKRLNG